MAKALITIRTQAELEGAQAAVKSMEQQIGRAKALGKDYSKLEAQMNRANAAIKTYTDANVKASQATTKHSVATTALIGKLKSLAAGYFGVTAAIGLMRNAYHRLSKGVEDYGEMQQQIWRLDRALATRGTFSEEYRNKIVKLADSYEALTGIETEQWLAGFVKLSQFGANSSNFDKLAEAMKNLMGFKPGTGAVEAANLLGRAMQGSFELFGREGINLEGLATDAEKLDYILQELARRGAGQLELAMKGVSGEFKSAKVSWSNFWKAIGGMADEEGWYRNLFGIGKALKPVRRTLKSWFDSVIEYLMPVVKVEKDVADGNIKISKTAEDAEVSFEKLAEAVKKVASAYSEAAKESKHLDDIEKAKASGLDAESAAQKALALSQLEFFEKAGLPAPIAAATRARIEKEYASRAFETGQMRRISQMRGAQARASEIDAVHQALKARAAGGDKMARSQLESFESQWLPRRDELRRQAEIMDIEAQSAGRAHRYESRAGEYQYRSALMGHAASPFELNTIATRLAGSDQQMFQGILAYLTERQRRIDWFNRQLGFQYRNARQ